MDRERSPVRDDDPPGPSPALYRVLRRKGTTHLGCPFSSLISGWLLSSSLPVFGN